MWIDNKHLHASLDGPVHRPLQAEVVGQQQSAVHLFVYGVRHQVGAGDYVSIPFFGPRLGGYRRATGGAHSLAPNHELFL